MRFKLYKVSIKMGKAENIKRAKRIKEAKRAKEAENELLKNTKTLADRHENTKSKVVENTSGIKYSEVLGAFALDILHAKDSNEETKGKILFAIMAWNMAVKNEKDGLSLEKEVKKFFKTAKIPPELHPLFTQLVKHKNENFSEHKVLFADFEISFSKKNQMNLSVATSVV